MKKLDKKAEGKMGSFSVRWSCEEVKLKIIKVTDKTIKIDFHNENIILKFNGVDYSSNKGFIFESLVN